ncbi:MAG: pyruvate formate-lyase [Chloroflexi bacterium]|nr:pyruvate formate-lyase [Chloroflexota bacterium]
MNERLTNLRQRVRQRQQTDERTTPAPDVWAECEAQKLGWMQRSAQRTRRMCEAERPVIWPEERIVFTRTIPETPPIYTESQIAEMTRGRILHELGPISNICADWGAVLADGLLTRRRIAQAARQRLADNPEAVEFLDAAIETIEAVLGLAARYAEAARAAGRRDLAEILEHVPAQAPRTFHEALQSLRLLQAVVWLSGHYHVGLGRFDQYMWPYLWADLQTGRLDLPAAEELVADFFIALNKDSDLYPGVQQGDNGQSLMLGGVTPRGEDAVNELTSMVLRAARDLSMIDPKINLRISTQTDLELLSLAAELTRKGLGFPQYSNDDLVIPALTAHGYDLEDARNYTVAACWEFIIPGKGMEVVNIGAVSFPHAVDQAIRQGLRQNEDFDAILERIRTNIRDQTEARLADYRKLFLPPAPYYSVLMDGCLATGRDLSHGLRYNNFGLHGAASANAADALAAVKRFVFEEKSLPPAELIAALEADFEGYADLRDALSHQAPKVANRDALADEMLVFLFDCFADACEGQPPNPRGGILRPGTGSAMYYVWLARGREAMREPVVGATADGRRSGDFFSANLAPSLGVRADSPLKVFESFSKIDYRRICNGGPVTIELSDSVFRNQEVIRKVAMLVRSFARMGGQQLQINSLNAETLFAARQHPERYPNLIVRVWGWSGYFCELAPEYQDHIIQRCLYQMAE